MSQKTHPHHAFFENLQECFNKAALVSGVTEKFFKIGGCEVRMLFASRKLAEKMIPALQHLIIDKSLNPFLTVHVWDDYTTNTKMPSFPWVNLPSKSQAVSIKQLNTKKTYVTYNMADRILSAYDSTHTSGFFWISDARKLPSGELTVPFKNILHKFLISKGVYMIHAGAVGILSGGVLLVGKGGAGKSTTALSCLDSDLFYAGDDYVLVSMDKTPMIYSIYSSAKLHKNNTWRVPHVNSAIINTPLLKQEKVHMFLNQTWPEKLISQFPLRAIFVPHVADSLDTKLTPATTKEVAHALMLSTVVQLSQTDLYAVRKLLEIIQSVPSYHLNLGTEMSQIPQVISKFLKEYK